MNAFLTLAVLCSVITAQPVTKSPTFKPTVPTPKPTFRPTASTNSVIYLYSDNVYEIDGDLGTRAETSFHCSNVAANLDLFCQTHTAFVSYSTSDNLLNIPVNHLGASPSAIAVKSASNVTIAANWNELFTYPRSISFLDAGVFPPHPELLEYSFFTGSNSDGTYTGYSDSCNSWTSGIDVDKGTVGQASNVDENSVNFGLADCNGVPITASHDVNRLVCVCFYDGR